MLGFFFVGKLKKLPGATFLCFLFSTRLPKNGPKNVYRVTFKKHLLNHLLNHIFVTEELTRPQKPPNMVLYQGKFSQPYSQCPVWARAYVQSRLSLVRSHNQLNVTIPMKYILIGTSNVSRLQGWVTSRISSVEKGLGSRSQDWSALAPSTWGAIGSF